MAITSETMSFAEAQSELGLSSLDQVAAAILAEQLGSSVSNVSYTGAGTAAFAVTNFAVAGQFSLNNGFLLSSGGFPGAVNTSGDFTVINGTAGDADLDAVAQDAFDGAGATRDASVLEFTVNVTDEDVTGIGFDIVFGSDEFPEWSNSSFVDIGAILINGVNVALFDNNPENPLSVIDQNLANYFVDNQGGEYAIEWDGFSHVLTVRGALQQGENTIKIGVADTGDSILDSGMLVTNLGFLEDGTGGGVLVVVNGTNKSDAITATAANEEINLVSGVDSVTGSPASLDGDTITGFGTDDKIVFKGANFGAAAISYAAATGALGVDTTGDGKDDVKMILAGPLDGAKPVATIVGGDTVLTMTKDDGGPNVIVGTKWSDKLHGTDGADIIKSLGGKCDVMWGAGGADRFVFGAEAHNSKQELDTIKDYRAGVDSIVLKGGAEIDHIAEKAHGVLITFEGDGDKLYIKGAALDVGDITIHDSNGLSLML